MNSSRIGCHWRKILLLLLPFAIGILIISTRSSPAQLFRAHPRDLQRDLNIATRHESSRIRGWRSLLNRRGGPSRIRAQVVRPATDAVYDTARRKGYALMCMMQNPALAGNQANSPWTRYSQLEEWGWSGRQGSNPITVNYANEQDRGIVSLVGNQGMTGMQGIVEHKTMPAHAPVTIGDKTYHYPATMAEYQNNFYPREGVIVAYYNFGPEYFINGLIKWWDPDTMRKPELSQLSDVWWLLWAEICANGGNDSKNLKHVVQKSVVNDMTQAVLARVLQMHWPEDQEIAEGRAPNWPGKLITPDMAGFDALLGTANIWTVPYMLLQRRAVLGKKEIKSIRAYNAAPRAVFYEVNLIMEIGDVDA